MTFKLFNKSLFFCIIMITVISLPQKSFANDIQNFINQSIYEMEGATTLKGHNRAYYDGGGFHYRAQSTNYQPFTMEAPSIEAGCNGIDIAFGGFSYLNADKIVTFGQKVLSHAPGLAFQQALHVLCPSCEAIMNKLTSLSNMINNMNFDSCAVGQELMAMGGRGLQASGIMGKDTNNSTSQGSGGPDWLETFENNVSRNFSHFVPDIPDWVTGKNQNTAFLSSKSPRSLLAYSLRNHTIFASGATRTSEQNNKYLNILRYYVGDIIRIQESSGKNAPVFEYIPAKFQLLEPQNKNNLKTDVARILGGDNCSGGNIIVDSVDFNGRSTTETVDPVCKIIYPQVSSIVSKYDIRNTSLTSTDFNFLGMFRIPAYKIFNSLSVYPGALQSVQNELSDMLSAETYYSFITEILKEMPSVIQSLSALKDNGQISFIDFISESGLLIRDIKNFQAIVFGEVGIAYNRFDKRVKGIITRENLRTRIMTQMAGHPIAGAFVFGKTIAGLR